ncbi:sodium-coupled monocarboxylate transporter 1-like isoform X2 [Liolophura sinensis]|uniref:sodium-coupled monocarboxylate transporter 1-like isoform X2 n=1 Tax=Liolophura sinensis TaxID=3198878 RepID=UPI003159900F
MATARGAREFQAADYAVMSAMLAVSVGIGVYYSIAGKGQRSSDDFLLAGRSMRFLPIAISVLASFFSASTLLGTPAEIYQYGTQYWISVFGAILAPLTGALLFGPLFFKLKIVSVFQVLGMGIVLYGPCTALSAATPVPTWSSIIVVGVVCTLYTFLGGLKAVIWTDVFQTLVMVAGMLAVLIQAIIEVGGMGRMWHLAEEKGRIEFFNFDPDPRVRHTFWTLVVGIYFVWLPPYTVDQQMVQRFSSARSLRDAKMALLFNIPGMFILITLCSLVGVALFATYADCDPLSADVISNPNQLLPLFVVQMLSFAPGLPGLLFASLFSGALSSISSMLNSLAAVTWEDFLKLKFGHLPDEKVTWVTRGLVVLYGVIGVGVAFLVEQLGGTVLQASLTINGAAGAPLVGIFILGAFFPCINWIGAIIGGVLGFSFSMWLIIGKYLTKPVDFKLPTSVEGCYFNVSNSNTSVSVWANSSQHLQGTSLKSDIHHDIIGLEQLYSISYLWFSAIGILSTILVGFLVSVITGLSKREDIDDNLLLSFPRNSGCYCCKRKMKAYHCQTKDHKT